MAPSVAEHVGRASDGPREPPRMARDGTATAPELGRGAGHAHRGERRRRPGRLGGRADRHLRVGRRSGHVLRRDGAAAGSEAGGPERGEAAGEAQGRERATRSSRALPDPAARAATPTATPAPARRSRCELVPTSPSRSRRSRHRSHPPRRAPRTSRSNRPPIPDRSRRRPHHRPEEGSSNRDPPPVNPARVRRGASRAALPSSASAGTYVVKACFSNAVNNAWYSSRGTRSSSTRTSTAARSSLGRSRAGMVARNTDGSGLAVLGAHARMTFDAPPGARIVYLSGGTKQYSAHGWQAGITTTPRTDGCRAAARCRPGSRSTSTCRATGSARSSICTRAQAAGAMRSTATSRCET